MDKKGILLRIIYCSTYYNLCNIYCIYYSQYGIEDLLFGINFVFILILLFHKSIMGIGPTKGFFPTIFKLNLKMIRNPYIMAFLSF